MSRGHYLMVGLRPSDLVEIADTARTLGERRHRATLLYLYARTEIDAHASAFDALARMSADGAPGLTTIALDMLAIHQGAFENSRSVAEVIDQRQSRLTVDLEGATAPVAPGLWPKVWRRLRDPKGTFEVLVNVGPTFMGLIRHVPVRLWPQAFTTARRANDAVLVYKRFLSFFARTLRELTIDASIIPEDIVGPIWPVLIRAAHDAHIPVLVCPYTLANQQEAIQSLKSQSAFQTGENAIANHLYPSWRFHDAEVDLVRLPSEHIFAHEELGITPPDPWMMNSGFADRILVDSDASLEYFRAGGIPPEQMAVVGSVSQDRMHALRQKRTTALQGLRSELNLADEKPLWLISGCPNQLSATVPFCEFATIEHVARFVGESLAPLAESYHLVVRPHPNFMEFGAMLARYGITSTTLPTSSLVPLAEVFVAFASATIRWAIACGLPTINYDVFHYGYSDFSAAKGVRTVADGVEFRQLVRSLTPGSPALQALAANAREDSAYWGVMDGRGIERIENEIERARERRMNSPKPAFAQTLRRNKEQQPNA